MTLIVTRITDLGIVFCSDRRLSMGNRRWGEVAKFLPIHRLNAGICYFGVAQVGNQQLTRWLQGFILKSTATTIGDFSQELATALTSQMSSANKTRGTGFHISGYEKNNGLSVPTFWHVSNFSGMNGYGYLSGNPTFGVSEDFLQRDVANIPVPSLSNHLSGRHYFYRNGQLFPYTIVHAFFEQLRSALPTQNNAQWSVPRTIEDFATDTDFEVSITEQIFKKYSRSQPVGGGIQTHVILPKGIYKFNRKTNKLTKI